MYFVYIIFRVTGALPCSLSALNYKQCFRNNKIKFQAQVMCVVFVVLLLFLCRKSPLIHYDSILNRSFYIVSVLFLYFNTLILQLLRSNHDYFYFQFTSLYFTQQAKSFNMLNLNIIRKKNQLTLPLNCSHIGL